MFSTLTSLSQIIYINAGEIIMNTDDIGDGDSLNDNINIMIDLGKGYSCWKGAVSVHRVWPLFTDMGRNHISEPKVAKLLHMLVHLYSIQEHRQGKRLFKCRHCDKAFAQNCNL